MNRVVAAAERRADPPQVQFKSFGKGAQTVPNPQTTLIWAGSWTHKTFRVGAPTSAKAGQLVLSLEEVQRDVPDVPGLGDPEVRKEGSGSKAQLLELRLSDSEDRRLLLAPMIGGGRTRGRGGPGGGRGPGGEDFTPHRKRIRMLQIHRIPTCD